MINEILFMNGYGAYVWSSFIFTLSGFFILYSVIKLQLMKEQKKFDLKLKNEKPKMNPIIRYAWVTKFLSFEKANKIVNAKSIIRVDKFKSKPS